jgi:transcriptional regulator with XRE-family HTH domain
MNLAHYFSTLRTDAKLSLREVAQKSRPKLDASVIWKIENGRSVKAKTLGQALRALGLHDTDEAYSKAFALWSTAQAQTLPHATVDHALTKIRRANKRAFDLALERIAAALQRTPEEDWPAMIEAVENPAALKLWLESTRLARK